VNRMNEKWLRYIFYLLSAVLLVVLLVAQKEAGISCDEVLHYDHSVSVYNYFASRGQDQSALNTPVTNLKYYGQSYDNFVTIVTKWFGIDDVYGFRHIMSAIAGWLAMIVTALFAIWLSGYTAGMITLILFALSPTFFGHSLNNLKDIPFALGYISGVFLILKFVLSDKKTSFRLIILLTIVLAFTISIRSGGLILICYLFLFVFVQWIYKYLTESIFDRVEVRNKIFIIILISGAAWFMSILLWPFALQSPMKNMIESYEVMAHFPSTFRQIFEGKVEWSDYMPWYYLLKSMLITIPWVVIIGLIMFLIFLYQFIREGKGFILGLICFTVLFPLLFVLYEKSNLYSSWRQFLFLYPVIVLLAALGFTRYFILQKRRYLLWFAFLWFAFLSLHPLRFMIKNHPYYYLYYNPFTGGLRGAYSNYETDYYYVSQTEASDWLINYIEQKNIAGKVKVKATYSVQWQFRNQPEIETSYFRWEERSMSDWDYAIVVNRYISPYQLNNKIWPPKNAIHIIYADEVPICAVIERKTKDDLSGYKALTEGRFKEAVNFYSKVFPVDDGDEMNFYNFAAALYKEGQYLKADSVLKKGLEKSPEFELILMYLGNIAKAQGKTDDAIGYYEKVIKANRKYFEAYVGLAKEIGVRDIMKARSVLRTCLKMSPHYKPAIVALADTYRHSDPDIAKKYDELANSIK
jgi:tetratricopeptide (TPR) repeat protein